MTQASDSQADLVLMDIRMPDIDGIEATTRITGDPALAGVKILMLTTYETPELLVGALRAGASSYLGKGTEPATRRASSPRGRPYTGPGQAASVTVPRST